MYLSVREHLLQPGLTDEQIATNTDTAAELELHMQELRDMIGQSFTGQGQA
jgi:hypothetical protein